MTTVHHPAPTDLKPYYLRGPDGAYTGDEYDTEQEACAAADDRPGCTAHLDLYVAENHDTWRFAGPHVTRPPTAPPVKPRWASWSWGDLD